MKDKVIEVLSKLLESNKINQKVYDVLLKHYLGRNDEENVLAELYSMVSETNFINQKLLDIELSDISIVDVNDGEYSSRTGIVPINEIMDKYEEGVSEGQSKGKQKTLVPTGSSKILHWGEDSGFMTFLLVIFLAGISSGIIFMIILNFLAK